MYKFRIFCQCKHWPWKVKRNWQPLSFIEPLLLLSSLLLETFYCWCCRWASFRLYIIIPITAIIVISTRTGCCCYYPYCFYYCNYCYHCNYFSAYTQQHRIDSPVTCRKRLTLENEKIERQLEKVSIDLESAVGHHYHFSGFSSSRSVLHVSFKEVIMLWPELPFTQDWHYMFVLFLV